MTATIDELWTVLNDLHMAAAHALAKPHDLVRRGALRRACRRATALADREAAERKLMDSLPGDGPAPEPEPLAESSAKPEGETHHAWQDRADLR